jgi:hypothetical protein
MDAHDCRAITSMADRTGPAQKQVLILRRGLPYGPQYNRL